MYQKLVAKIEGKPEERILSYLMLRSLKQARYSTENEGHFALAADTYTHFTSPIRRYPDLIVHRLLKAHSTAARPRPELRAIAEECSQSERRAADAERELVEWKKVQVHGRPRGRGVRRADHHHRQVRPVRGTGRSCSSRAWCLSTRCPAIGTPITRTCARSWAGARAASSRSATACA